MSNGLNRRFMRDPVRFMGEIVIHTTDLEKTFARYAPNPNAAHLLPGAGIAAFDLQRDAHGNVQLQAHGFREKLQKGRFTRYIRAYWLPWDDGAGVAVSASGTVRLDLGREADFFFTSQLSGCRMQAAVGADGPTMLHIPGNMGGASNEGRGPAGAEWREDQARTHLPNRFPDSRRWSSTIEYAAHSTVNFVGVRRGDRWMFYSQTVHGDATLPRVAHAFLM